MRPRNAGGQCPPYTLRRADRGFTLLEMMLVVTIALLMMMLLVPIFTITTKTVRTVERKLALYEAARNVLDLVELDIQQAVMNERGEHLSLKHIVLEDTDPFTPAGRKDVPDPAAFRSSRRVADAIHYAKHQPVGLVWNGLSEERRSIPFPACYSTHPNWPQCYKAVLRSNLLYRYPFDKATLLADVSQIDTYMQSVPLLAAQSYSATRTPQYMYENEPEEFFAAGNEVHAPGYVPINDWPWILSSYKVVDLNFSYWDDVERKFKDLPEGTAVYFAPFPKALRTTITVTDLEKRIMGTFVRVTRVPVGMGKGAVANVMDNTYRSPSPFNRPKDLQAVDPKVFQQ